MTATSLKLTIYLGEADRSGGELVANRLMDAFAAQRFATSLLLRGSEGFGAKHGLHTERLLTLSEDLPLVAVAVDERERIEAALPEIAPLVPAGLVSLELAHMLADEAAPATATGDEAKLTLYLGRHDRFGGAAAHVAAIETLHRHGVAGATVLLGVDGTARGERHRARMFGRNAGVPLMLIAVGARGAIDAALPELPAAIATLENVRVCKRDGAALAPPHSEAEEGYLQKLMVYSREQPRLVLDLRAAGAAGATSLRGVFGYHGEHEPHGERFLSLRRRLPTVTVVVDTSDRIAELWPVVDRATAEHGLVTSELVRPVPR